MTVTFIRPTGCPAGIDPINWRKALETRIERQAAILSALVDALDAMDGDCDLEANGDAEPWLGWAASGATADRNDLELDAPERYLRAINLHEVP